LPLLSVVKVPPLLFPVQFSPVMVKEFTVADPVASKSPSAKAVHGVSAKVERLTANEAEIIKGFMGLITVQAPVEYVLDHSAMGGFAGRFL
jgi:hypothetical protein